MSRNGSVHKTVELHQMNEFVPRYGPNYEYMGPRGCHDSHGESEIQLACGCMLPVVAGAFSPDGQQKLERCQAQMIPCSSGKVMTRTCQ